MGNTKRTMKLLRLWHGNIVYEPEQMKVIQKYSEYTCYSLNRMRKWKKMIILDGLNLVDPYKSS